MCYVELAQHLGASQPLYGLQVPDLDGQGESLGSIEGLAAHYVEAVRGVQPQGPYLLGGWSMGGVIAFEMAQQLAAHRQEVGLLVMLDVFAPSPGNGELPDDATLMALVARDMGMVGESFQVAPEDLRPLAGAEALEYVLEQGRAAHLVPPDVGVTQARVHFNRYKNNVRALSRYTPQVYPGRLTLLRAVDQPAKSSADPALDWGRWTTGDIEIQSIPGSHSTILQSPHVEVLAEWHASRG